MTQSYKYIPIFNVALHIRIYDTEQSARRGYKALCRKHDCESDDDPFRARVFFDEKGSEFYVLFVKPDLKEDKTELISHEVVHITEAILKAHGMNVRKTEEMFALLSGYLNKVIAKFVKKNKIKLG